MTDNFNDFVLHNIRPFEEEKYLTEDVILVNNIEYNTDKDVLSVKLGKSFDGNPLTLLSTGYLVGTENCLIPVIDFHKIKEMKAAIENPEDVKFNSPREITAWALVLKTNIDDYFKRRLNDGFKASIELISPPEETSIKTFYCPDRYIAAVDIKDIIVGNKEIGRDGQTPFSRWFNEYYAREVSIFTRERRENI